MGKVEKPWSKIDKGYVGFIANYFQEPFNNLKRKTSLMSISKGPHDFALLSYEIEDKYGFEVKDYQDATLQTVGGLVKFIKYNIAGMSRRKAE